MGKIFNQGMKLNVNKKLEITFSSHISRKEKICLQSKNSSKSFALKSLGFGMHHVQLVLPKLFNSFAFLTQRLFFKPW